MHDLCQSDGVNVGGRTLCLLAKKLKISNTKMTKLSNLPIKKQKFLISF